MLETCYIAYSMMQPILASICYGSLEWKNRWVPPIGLFTHPQKVISTSDICWLDINVMIHMATRQPSTCFKPRVLYPNNLLLLLLSVFSLYVKYILVLGYQKCFPYNYSSKTGKHKKLRCNPTIHDSGLHPKCSGELIFKN